MTTFTRYTVPSNLEIALGLASIRTVDVDVYREHGGGGPKPYRAKINGALLRTASGQVAQFRTMAAAIKATEVAP